MNQLRSLAIFELASCLYFIARVVPVTAQNNLRGRALSNCLLDQLLHQSTATLISSSQEAKDSSWVIDALDCKAGSTGKVCNSWEKWWTNACADIPWLNSTTCKYYGKWFARRAIFEVILSIWGCKLATDYWRTGNERYQTENGVQELHVEVI